MKNQIELDNVSHYFDTPTDRINLFQNLSLSIRGGSSHSIMGASGAGKSSLLTLVAGLDDVKSGTIKFTINGDLVSAQSLRAHSGFIFQHFHLMPELDALSNLALPLRLKGDRQAYKIAKKWLDKVGLCDRAHHKPNQLSGGEQQRIAVARAFVTQPSFIFADEPTGNLDEGTSMNVSDLLFDFVKESGAALLVVTHSHRLASMANHCHKLSKGQLELVA